MDDHHYSRDRNLGLWVESPDMLFVAAYSSVASLVVRFSGLFRKANGEILQYAIDVSPTSDRAVTSTQLNFGAGFLLTCVAHLASGNASRGQCYVRVRTQRNTGTPMVVLHQLLGGYLTDDFSPSFPYGTIEGPLEGAGMLRSIAGTNPAAGAEISETVPTGARWRLYSLSASLVTDATVANRTATLLVDDGTTTLWRTVTSSNQAASLTVLWSFAQTGINQAIAGTVIGQSIPSVIPLAAGYRVATVTVNLQAGDNWGAPQLAVEEWIEA